MVTAINPFDGPLRRNAPTPMRRRAKSVYIVREQSIFGRNSRTNSQILVLSLLLGCLTRVKQITSEKNINIETISPVSIWNNEGL